MSVTTTGAVLIIAAMLVFTACLIFHCHIVDKLKQKIRQLERDLNSEKEKCRRVRVERGERIQQLTEELRLKDLEVITCEAV